VQQPAHVLVVRASTS